MNEEFISLTFNVSDQAIIDKLEILRLERGISTHSFIIAAIAEKLHKEGYLSEYRKHEKIIKKRTTEMDDLCKDLQKMEFQRMRMHRSGQS